MDKKWIDLMKIKPNDAVDSNALDHYGNPTLGPGLTKREYFAALCLKGLCAPCIPGNHNSNGKIEAENKVTMAIRLADALINKLNEPSGE